MRKPNEKAKKKINKTFSTEVRERIYKRAGCQCENYKDPKCMGNVGLSIHHIIHNTKTNNNHYGEENIQSEENGILLCDWCHNHYSMINLSEEKRKELEKRWKK